MPTRSASAIWQGDLPHGHGDISLSSGAFKGQYSFKSRFENGPGTNPEELLASAHAGCFSMALSHILASAGFVPTSVSTKADVTVDKVGDGFKITHIVLTTDAVVPNIDDKTFQEKGHLAKAGCPISQALAAVPSIELKATLKS